MCSFHLLAALLACSVILVQAVPHEVIEEEKYEFKVDYYEEPVRPLLIIPELLNIGPRS